MSPTKRIQRLLGGLVAIAVVAARPNLLPAAEDTPSGETAEIAARSDVEAVEVERPTPAKKLRFNFRYAPWDEVLNWIAKEADVSFALDITPSGTFNYVDEDREYTPDEAMDEINGVLLTKGYTLVRRGKMLLIVDLEDEIDAELVSNLLVEIPMSQLDRRGDFELTKTRFHLEKVDAEIAKSQIEAMIGPHGSIVVMPELKQLMVTETGANLRTIRQIIETLEKNNRKGLQTFTLEHATAEEVLLVARPLLDIEEDKSAPEDGSVHISADPLGRTVFATGKADKVALVEQIVQQIDAEAGAALSGGAVESPQFMLHRISTTDPDAVLRVLQTMFAGDQMVRLEIDRATGGIFARAKPSQHMSIKATIREMEQDPEQVSVIPLAANDPATAAVLLERIFGAADGSGTPDAPIIDITIDPPQLVVRGTTAQIGQIKELLGDMGERFEAGGIASRRGKIRMINMDPDAVQTALGRLEQLWPTFGDNRIRLLGADRAPLIQRRRPASGQEPANARENEADAKSRVDDKLSPDLLESTIRSRKSADERRYRVISISQTTPLSQTAENEEGDEQAAPTEDESDVAQPIQTDSAPITRGVGAESTEPDIVISPGPNGLMIASEDEEALDTLVSLLGSLAEPSGGQARYNLFYLKHVEAETAKTLVTSILDSVGTTVTTSASSNSDRGGVLGMFLSGGGTSAASGGGMGAPYMVADNRLNALFVQGTATQIDTVDQLLDVIDIESGPEEVLTIPKPKNIPVYYTSAESVAEVIRQLYPTRIATGQQNQQNQQNQQRGGGGRGGGFFGGGFGGRSGNSQGATTDEPKMTVAADTTSNSLWVSAPGPLLKEVEAVVREIDFNAHSQPNESVKVISLKNAPSELVQQAITNVFGEEAQTSSSSSGSTRSGQSGARTAGSAPTPEQIQQRRAQFFNALRGGGGFGGRGGGPGGGGGGGRRGGGGR